MSFEGGVGMQAYRTNEKLSNPHKHPRLVANGKVLAVAPSIRAAEETRDRWAEFGLEAVVVVPKRVRT